MADVFSRLRRILTDNLDVEDADVKPESDLIEDLGADSLSLVEILLGVEEEFELDIPDDDTEKIRTVQEAVTYIEGRLKPVV
jgi:acyl carrier protein